MKSLNWSLALAVLFTLAESKSTNANQHDTVFEDKKQEAKVKLLTQLNIQEGEDRLDIIKMPAEIKDGLTTVVWDFIFYHPNSTVIFPNQCQFELSNSSDYPSLLSLYKNKKINLNQISLVNCKARCYQDNIVEMSQLLLKIGKVWFHGSQDDEMWKLLGAKAVIGNSSIQHLYLSYVGTTDDNIDYITDLVLFTPKVEFNGGISPEHWENLSSALESTANKTIEYIGLGFIDMNSITFKHIFNMVLSVETLGLWNNFAENWFYWYLFFKTVEERQMLETMKLKTVWIYEAYLNPKPSAKVQERWKKYGITINTHCRYFYQDCS